MTIPPGASVACGVDTLEPVCSRYVVEHRIIRLVRNEVRKHTVRKYGIQSTWFGYRFFSARAVRFELINRKSPPGTVNKYTQALTRTGGRTYRWRPASPQPARAAAPPTHPRSSSSGSSSSAPLRMSRKACTFQLMGGEEDTEHVWMCTQAVCILSYLR